MPRPQPKLEFTISEGSLWRHKKTGDVYVVVGNGFIEEPMAQAVFYKRVDTVRAVTWVRPQSEFSDGRFEQFRRTSKTHANQTPLSDDFLNAN